MPASVKGGLFVGAAVMVGILAGLLVPTLVGAERAGGKGTRAHTAQLPTMPSVVGRPLDEAKGELRRRRIAYVTDAPSIVEAVAPGILEVCESVPAPGAHVRGSARLHAELAGTCGI
jgi:hypothetical protein